MKISIPKPCHENWNTMTPNEQGSFCGKCCKTVIDFTNKTVDEIKNVLSEQRSKKICGRFMPYQLDENPKPSTNLSTSIYSFPPHLSYRQAFAIAIFFVFGSSLFSCTAFDNSTTGKIAIIDAPTTIAQVPEGINKIIGDTIITVSKKNNDTMKPVKKCSSLKGEVCIKPIKGKVKLNTDTINTTITKDTMPARPMMGRLKMK